MLKEVLVLLMLPIAAFGDTEKMSKNSAILKVSVLTSNTALLNGIEVGLDELSAALIEAVEENGMVWYYRENAAGDPPPVSSQVIQMINDNKLPIRMFTEADFSDYIDENGDARPR